MHSTTSRTVGRWVGIAASVTALTVLGTGTAWAHDCINASRSAQGDTMSGTRSQGWVQFAIADFIAQDVANGLYDADAGACIYAAWLAGGGPATLTFHAKGVNGTDGVIGLNNPNTGLYANGKGIDHFDALYGPLIVSAFTSCGVDQTPVG